MSKMIINENSSIRDLTNGEYSSLSYSPSGDNYAGPLVEAVINMIDKTGCDVTNTRVNAVGSTFRDIILNYQKKFGLPETGRLDDDLLHDIYNRANNNSSDEISSTDGYSTYEDDPSYTSDILVDPHYDPFFLNGSTKIYRRNHKDIIIAFGDGSNHKIIKDVFMRSMAVQVDTSGNPISEVYNFIARDIKESDAEEDYNKYIGESNEMSASSDIKYSYNNLYKDD